MRPALIQEPELEFGADKHIDIRYGIMNYGPLDYKTATAPKRINIGIIGTPQTIEGLTNWLETCRGEVASKESNFYNLYPKFPGFNLETAFLSTLILDQRLHAVIPDRTIDILSKNDNFNQMVFEAVSLVLRELEHLAEKRPNVIICAMPKGLHEAIEENRNPVGRFKQKSDEVKFDFHDMLKAASMRFRVPIQLVWPSTYDPTKQLKSKRKTNNLETFTR